MFNLQSANSETLKLVIWHISSWLILSDTFWSPAIYISANILIPFYFILFGQQPFYLNDMVILDKIVYFTRNDNLHRCYSLFNTSTLQSLNKILAMRICLFNVNKPTPYMAIVFDLISTLLKIRRRSLWLIDVTQTNDVQSQPVDWLLGRNLKKILFNNV